MASVVPGRERTGSNSGLGVYANSDEKGLTDGHDGCNFGTKRNLTNSEGESDHHPRDEGPRKLARSG